MVATAGDQLNIYDINGTILYRAVPYNSPAVNSKTAVCDDVINNSGVKLNLSENEVNTAVVDNNSTAAALNMSGEFSGSFAVPRSKTLRKHLSSTPAATPRVAEITSHETIKEEITKPTQNTTPAEVVLAKLFPPEVLQQDDKTVGDNILESTISLSCLSAQHLWMKVAAVDHTSRLDCVHLQDHLERRCKEENARPSGVVCKNREGIFTDGLWEIIRQTTVLCPERGVLLAELAAEMQQTTDTYDILFESALQYMVRKRIERDMRSYLFDEKEKMASEVRRLENRVNELRAKHYGMVKRFEEQKQAEQNRHEEEVKYLKKVNQQIVNEIKRFTALDKTNVSVTKTT